jgi:anthranilate phosphoribosyltransferase
MDMQAAIRAVTTGRNLTASEMERVMHLMMTGAATPAQIGAFLIGLRMKGETVEEIVAAARVMRSLVRRVDIEPEYLVDTCGTGGDAVGSFNISTAGALVAAATGCKVAKHGNRSVSSRSGSADVLEAAGVRLNLTPQQIAGCIRALGVGFLFAPEYHAAMKHAIGPRREIGVCTLFNLLGPLTNPAGVRNQLIGVFSQDWVEPLAQVLKRLGSRHVLVVHAEDGMDEISISAPTWIAELKDGEVQSLRVTPEQFGLARADISALKVDSPQQSLALIRSVLNNTPGPARDVVALNAGAAIYVAGRAVTLKQGVEQALDTLARGQARSTLEALIEYTSRHSCPIPPTS